MQSRPRHGFTLIELLVVIAIIAILAAILFPVFARAREQARKTACLSNMKQIGTALYMYAQDYDETLPERYGCNDAPGPCGWDYETINSIGYVRTWKSMLVPYIKSRDVYKCPSNSAAQHGTLVLSTASPGQPAENLNYPAGYEMYLFNWNGPPAGLFPNGNPYPQTLPSLQYPAQELIIIETHYGWPDIGSYESYCEPSGPTCDSASFPGASSWSSGHAKKAGNIVYMDSHAKYRHYRDTFVDDPGRGENDWRYSYNWAKANGYGWMNTTPDQMDSYPNDSGSL